MALDDIFNINNIMLQIRKIQIAQSHTAKSLKWLFIKLKTPLE